MLGPRGTSGTCRPPHNPSEADRENMVDRPPIVVHAGVGSIILSEMAQNPGLVDDAVREKLTVPGMLAADGVVPLRNGGAPPHRLALLWQTPADFALVDQFGEEWHLHDFCDSTVMLEFSGFT